MNIEEMAAGHEIDALVAEKVMGFKLVKAGDVPIGWNHECSTTPPRWIVYNLKRDSTIIMTPDLEEDIKKTESGLSSCYAAHGPVRTVPAYSTDIASAWEVLHKVHEKLMFCEVVITRWSEGDGWNVCFCSRGGLKEVNGDVGWMECWQSESDKGKPHVRDAAPLAICRAALKAVL